MAQLIILSPSDSEAICRTNAKIQIPSKETLASPKVMSLILVRLSNLTILTVKNILRL